MRKESEENCRGGINLIKGLKRGNGRRREKLMDLKGQGMKVKEVQTDTKGKTCNLSIKTLNAVKTYKTNKSINT